MLRFAHMRRPLRTTLIALATASALALLELYRMTVTRVLQGGVVTWDDLLFGVVPLWTTVVIASPWCRSEERRVGKECH